PGIALATLGMYVMSDIYLLRQLRRVAWVSSLSRLVFGSAVLRDMAFLTPGLVLEVGVRIAPVNGYAHLGGGGVAAAVAIASGVLSVRRSSPGSVLPQAPKPTPAAAADGESIG